MSNNTRPTGDTGEQCALLSQTFILFRREGTHVLAEPPWEAGSVHPKGTERALLYHM